MTNILAASILSILAGSAVIADAPLLDENTQVPIRMAILVSLFVFAVAMRIEQHFYKLHRDRQRDRNRSDQRMLWVRASIHTVFHKLKLDLLPEQPDDDSTTTK